MNNGACCQNGACSRPPSHHLAVDEDPGFPVPASHFSGGSGPKVTTTSPGLQPVFQPIIEGRLFTGLDAYIDPTWPITPLVALQYDALNEEDKETFLKCKAHQQYHQALIDFITYARKNPQTPPPQEMLDRLCHLVQSQNPKKRWTCSMKECPKPADTQEHIRGHLLGLYHFNNRFFVCQSCKRGFARQHDLVRHNKKPCRRVTQNNDDADHEDGTHVEPSNIGNDLFGFHVAPEQPILQNTTNIANLNQYHQRNAPFLSATGSVGVSQQPMVGFPNNMIAQVQPLVTTGGSIPRSTLYGYNPNPNPGALPIVHPSYASSSTTTNVTAIHNQSLRGLNVEQGLHPESYTPTPLRYSQPQQFAKTFQEGQSQMIFRVPSDKAKGRRYDISNYKHMIRSKGCIIVFIIGIAICTIIYADNLHRPHPYERKGPQ